MKAAMEVVYAAVVRSVPTEDADRVGNGLTCSVPDHQNCRENAHKIGKHYLVIRNDLVYDQSQG